MNNHCTFILQKQILARPNVVRYGWIAVRSIAQGLIKILKNICSVKKHFVISRNTNINSIKYGKRGDTIGGSR